MNKQDKQFLENNGHYWVRLKGTKVDMVGQYDKENELFKCNAGIVYLKDCEVKSDLILRETA